MKFLYQLNKTKQTNKQKVNYHEQQFLCPQMFSFQFFVFLLIFDLTEICPSKTILSRC